MTYLIFYFSFLVNFDIYLLEGEPWCSGKVVPWWLVGHGFESGNSLFAYARVRLRELRHLPKWVFLFLSSLWFLKVWWLFELNWLCNFGDFNLGVRFAIFNLRRSRLGFVKDEAFGTLLLLSYFSFCGGF